MVSIAGHPSFETMLFDFWEFDAAGKVRSALQFADAARIASEFAAMAR